MPHRRAAWAGVKRRPGISMNSLRTRSTRELVDMGSLSSLVVGRQSQSTSLSRQFQSALSVPSCDASDGARDAPGWSSAVGEDSAASSLKSRRTRSSGHRLKWLARQRCRTIESFLRICMIATLGRSAFSAGSAVRSSWQQPPPLNGAVSPRRWPRMLRGGPPASAGRRATA
jgi:hypothetical protein